MAENRIYGKKVSELTDEEQKKIMELLDEQQKVYEKERQGRFYVGIDRNFLMDSKRIKLDLIKADIHHTNITFGGICDTTYMVSIADWHKFKHQIDLLIEAKTKKLQEQIKRMDGETGRLREILAALDDPDKGGVVHFPC